MDAGPGRTGDVRLFGRSANRTSIPGPGTVAFAYNSEMFINLNEVYRVLIAKRIHVRGVDRMVPSVGRRERSVRKHWPVGEFDVGVAELGFDKHDVCVTGVDDSRFPRPETDNFIVVVVRASIPECVMD